MYMPYAVPQISFNHPVPENSTPENSMSHVIQQKQILHNEDKI